jgi:hypothetical protein
MFFPGLLLRFSFSGLCFRPPRSWAEEKEDKKHCCLKVLLQFTVLWVLMNHMI